MVAIIGNLLGILFIFDAIYVFLPYLLVAKKIIFVLLLHSII